MEDSEQDKRSRPDASQPGSASPSNTHEVDALSSELDPEALESLLPPLPTLHRPSTPIPKDARATNTSAVPTAPTIPTEGIAQIETTLLAPSAVDGATLLLSPKDGATEGATLLLSQAAAADGAVPESATTELLASDAPEIPGAILPPPITPASVLPPPITPAPIVGRAGRTPTLPRQRSSMNAADVSALLEEARQALEAAPMGLHSRPSFPSETSRPSVPPSFMTPAPNTPPGRQTAPPESPESPQRGSKTSGRSRSQAMINALRGQMGSRGAIWGAALALLRRPSTLLIALFVIVQALALTLWSSQGPADPGSALLAPLIGTVGAQLCAILLTALMGLATVGAARNLFGAPVALCAALAFILSGPILYTAHLGVANQLALTSSALSFWALTKASVARESRWLILTAFAFVIAALAEYHALLLLLCLACVALVRYRRAGWWFSLYVWALIVAAIGVAVANTMLLHYASPIIFQSLNTSTGRDLSVTLDASLIEICSTSVVIWALAIAGWMAARWRGEEASALGVAMFVYPVFFAAPTISQNAVHLVIYGFIFALPLAGVALAALWSADHGRGVKWRIVAWMLIMFLAAAGLYQARALDIGDGSFNPSPIHLTVTIPQRASPTIPTPQPTPTFSPPAAGR